jgi:PA14 domain
MRLQTPALLVCLVVLCGGCAVTTPVAPQIAPKASVTLPSLADNSEVQSDWRWVQGMVYVPTNCVNEAQQWDEYDPAINERELHYASVYGINVVRVYLHYYVYLKKKDALLANIEDFLGRASKYGIKTEFVFFDDCWNQPPKDLLSSDYHYPAPIPGVHNSQWLVCPGDDVRLHYEQHRRGLKAYVQDIVSAHRDDARVVFWEIYNEPNKSEATVRLEKDAAIWIKETGTPIPATATDKEYSGGPFSDFISWHQYGNYDVYGGAHTLCTECMNRQGQSVPGVVEHYKGKVGYIMWELGIGRDNCRFAWENNREKPRADETPTPFHGVVYPDGHPWSLADARALLTPAGFVKTPFFAVDYYKDRGFTQLAKHSLTPMIDFDLGDEDGTGSPDASAGVPKDHYSVQYKGDILAPTSGAYALSVETDGRVDLSVDGKLLLSKRSEGRTTSVGIIQLDATKTYNVTVRYVHATGPTSLHVTWSGPGVASQPLLPATHPQPL